MTKLKKKIYKFLTKLTGKKRKRTSSINTRIVRGIGMTDLTGIKKIIMKFYKPHYPNKCDNVNEMDKFLKNTT